MKDEARDMNVLVNIYSAAIKAFFPNKFNS